MFDYIFRLETLQFLLLILFVPSCIGLIVIVLLQKGKGTSFAGAFGVGPGSETVFGPRARKSLPVKLTYIMAAIFMLFSLSLSLIGSRIARGSAPEQVIGGENATAPVQQQPGSFQGLESLGLGGATPASNASAPAESAPATPPAEAPAPAAATPAQEAPAEAPAAPPAEAPAAPPAEAPAQQ
ncbi:MAG: preprotein translocase subunit SecG [Candidatus Hydrogenedentes bacterium]|nr:preprotein translocase subunit SecG [Candidatus Hydrogenedentota bacterium]